jgi:TusA-related sulfurtransferase
MIGYLKMLKPGQIVSVCSDTTDDCVKMIRDWCRDNGYTKDTVRILKRDGQTIAELK